MPQLFDFVRPAGSAHVVGNDKHIRLLKLDAPPMGEPGVAAFGFNKSRSRSSANPGSRPRVCRPNRTVRAARPDRAHRFEWYCAPSLPRNQARHSAFAGISVGSWIDQDLSAPAAQHDTQRVGVAVTGASARRTARHPQSRASRRTSSPPDPASGRAATATIPRPAGPSYGIGDNTSAIIVPQQRQAARRPGNRA